MASSKQSQWVFGAGVVAVLAAAAIVLRPWLTDDAAWCRRVFVGLAQGSQYVYESIDWERLKALDRDIGAEYRALPNEDERMGYRQAFIGRFAAGLREGKAQHEDFTNWRVVERGAGRVTVAADYSEKQSTLLFQISELGGRRLEGIRWQVPGGGG